MRSIEHHIARNRKIELESRIRIYQVFYLVDEPQLNLKNLKLPTSLRFQVLEFLGTVKK